MRFGVALTLLVWGMLGDSQGGEPAPFMMIARVEGQVVEGQPLVWTQRQMLLLGRDGQLHEFAPSAAKQAKKTAPAFRGYTVNEMRGRLRQEFDSSFDVTHTSHFVVVHPRGPWRAWADRLEMLFRSFTHYMRVRGFSIREPQVPLVAVVLRSESDYYRHAAANGTVLQPGTLGHYDPQSNRIFMYPVGESSSTEWSENADTIIHEATHQAAFNTGVHRRFAEQPRWLVEGLAMMFETRGVWDARSSQTRSDRINRGRLDDFRGSLNRRDPSTIVKLAAGDELFRRDPATAYAETWTLTFFLCETRPREYCSYLETVAARPAFSEYPARARLNDFAQHFGSDFTQLDAELRRFVAELK